MNFKYKRIYLWEDSNYDFLIQKHYDYARIKGEFVFKIRIHVNNLLENSKKYYFCNFCHFDEVFTQK
jgi:hypothetical protein